MNFVGIMLNKKIPNAKTLHTIWFCLYNTSSIGIDHRFIVAHDEGMGRVQEAGGVVIKGKYEESLW